MENIKSATDGFCGALIINKVNFSQLEALTKIFNFSQLEALTKIFNFSQLEALTKIFNFSQPVLP